MKPLLAYSVQDWSAERGEVVFARDARVARREGASLIDSDWESVECRRASEFDDQAPGPVSFAVKFDHGWWRDCDGCGRRMQLDADEDDESGFGLFDLVEEGENVWCTPACREHDLAERAKRKRHEARVLRVMDRSLRKRVPGAEPAEIDKPFQRHAYVRRNRGGYWRVEQAIVSFDFPGRALYLRVRGSRSLRVVAQGVSRRGG